jgi:MFS family permease
MRPLKPGQVAAVAAGNALEFYDFLTYSFFAASIGRTFFPSASAGGSLLASLATFGVGFLMRPVGAVVIGRIADKAGRKPAMLTSFGLMGLAVAALACTPSYAQIGPAAYVLVIGLRLVQGFALGGEVGPSTAFLVEAADPGRRGLQVAFQYVGQHGAVMTAGLVGFTLARTLPAPMLDAWGWRIAFLGGVTIIPFGLWLRRGLGETLDREPPAPAPNERPAPALTRLVALGLILLAGNTTVTYLGNYMTTYATESLHMDKAVGFGATIAVGAFGIAGALIGGPLSDRIGRKPVMLAPWGVLLLLLIPLFRWLDHERTATALLTASALVSFANTCSNSATLTAIAEGLPARIRGRSLGMIYAVSISIFGGSTQFTVAALTQALHSNLAPAWYATGAVAISFAAMAFLPETAPRRGVI